MASRRSSASSSASGGAGGRTVWLALAWLCFLAWLALLSFNTAPYIAGRRAWKPASDLPQRLIALPAPLLAALHLSPALATSAAWIIAALALFLGVLVTSLTFSSYTPGAEAASRSVSAAVNARLAALITQDASPTPHVPLPAPITPASAATTPLAESQPSPAVAATLSPSGRSGQAGLLGLLGQAGHMAHAGRAPRVFISHSSADNDFGLGLAQWLKASLGDDDTVFYDSDGGLLGGDEWPQRLQFELGEADVFVLILSPQALASGWVRKEWNYALRRAVSIGGKVIIPVLHQETPVWPFLADYQIIDFSAPGQFEVAFADLLVAVRLGRSRMAELRGLRGERRGPPFDVDKLPLPERFIGRDADIAWALERLAPELSLTDAHVVDVVDVVDVGNGRVASGLASIAAANGLAGIGKSALAGVVARILYATNRYADGIAVVACNGLDDPIAVLRRALARFDPEEREPPEDTLDDLASLAKRVFSQLPHALIVLDNIEPDLAIEQVTAALRVAGAALLLTSRQRLSASAAPPEDSRELDLLTLDEAVAVFIENRERSGQTFAQVDADLRESDRAAIADIVMALGRHTLAVKLAAARTKGRDLARLAREYAADPRLGVNLRDGAEAVDVTLASSVASLSDAARLLFAALGAFASGDIGRDALLAVGAALSDPDPIRSLDALLDLRLADAIVDTTLPEGADRERLRLHPLVHAYARDLLDGARRVADDAPCSPERRAETQRAVATWYAGYANATPDEALLPDESNIAGALAWAESAGDDRLLARLSGGMVDYWETRSRTDTRKHVLPLAVVAAQRLAESSGNEREDRLLAARLELAHGALLHMLGDLAGARSLIERSLETRVEFNDLREEGVAHGKLGDVALREGDLPAARDAYQRYLEIMRSVGDLREEGVARSKLGDVVRQEGDLSAARDAYQRVLAIMQRVGDLRSEGAAIFKLAQVLDMQGEFDEAERMRRRSLEIGYQVQSPPDVADSLLGLGRFLLAHGRDVEEGRRMLGEAEAIYTTLGPSWQARADSVKALLEQPSVSDVAQALIEQPSGGDTQKAPYLLARVDDDDAEDDVDDGAEDDADDDAEDDAEEAQALPDQVSDQAV